MSKWVLQDGTHFFKQMTGIGPMSTSDIFEACEFDTKEEAQMSPAMRFALMSYVPAQVSDTHDLLEASLPLHMSSDAQTQSSQADTRSPEIDKKLREILDKCWLHETVNLKRDGLKLVDGNYLNDAINQIHEVFAQSAPLSTKEEI